MEDRPQLTPGSLNEINQRVNTLIVNFKGKIDAFIGRNAILPKEQPEPGAGSQEASPGLSTQEKIDLFSKINKLVREGDFGNIKEIEVPVTSEGALEARAAADLLAAQKGVSLHELKVGDVVYWTGAQGQRYYYLIEEPYEDTKTDIFGKKGKGSLQGNGADEEGNPIQEVINNARIYGSSIGSMIITGRIAQNCSVEFGVFSQEKTDALKQVYEQRKSSGKPVVPRHRMNFNYYDTYITSTVESFGVIRREKLQESK